MVHRTLRKRRSKRHSKRHSKRSIKRYRRHAKTRIRRNMYRKKHKKTQRGGEFMGFRFSNLLPGKWKFSRVSGLKLPTSVQTYRSMNGNQELSYYIGTAKIDIPASNDKNTLNGKRYLKGNIKIWSDETKNFTDDGDILYFLITSVNKRNLNFNVSVQRILFKNSDTVNLSSDVMVIILQPDSDVGSDYKNIGGFLPNKVNDKLQVVTSLTSVDLENIPDPYNAPEIY